MGTKLSKDFSIVQEFKNLGTQMPFVGDHEFETDLTKEVFMSVNVVRNNPKKFIPHIEHVVDELNVYKGKKSGKFLSWLKGQPEGFSLPPLSIDYEAMQATKLNNETLKSVSKPTDIPDDANKRYLG